MATHSLLLSGQTAGGKQLDFNCPFESAELMCSCVTIAINVKTQNGTSDMFALIICLLFKKQD